MEKYVFVNRKRFYLPAIFNGLKEMFITGLPWATQSYNALSFLLGEKVEKLCNSTQNANCRLTNYINLKLFRSSSLLAHYRKIKIIIPDIDLAMQSLFISTATVDAAALALLGVIVNQAEFLTNG